MKKKLNLLVRGIDSFNGYQTKILNRVWDKIDCNKCVIISRNWDGKDKYGNKYVEIPYKGNDCEYYNIGKMLTIPEEVLIGMKKYESMIYETIMRGCEISVFTFDECKQKYYKELLYWYSLIKKFDINFILFHNAPHMTHDYVIYCLSMVLNIPRLLFEPTIFKGRLPWGTTFENLGEATRKRYDELLKENKNSVEFEFMPDIQRCYDMNCDQDENVIKLSNKKSYKEQSKYLSLDDNIYFSKKKIKQRHREIFRNNTSMYSIVENLKRDWDITKRCKMKINNSIQVHKYVQYDELTEELIDRKYIYYGLHLYPDMTVIPRSYAFHAQIFNIAILVKAAQKEGIYVYIKEHWAQVYRNKEFYKYLKSFPNVKLLGPSEDNMKLIWNSMAVSSIAGSCIVEGMYRKIPAIVFGDGFSTNRPGAFRVRDIETCREAIKKIKNKEYDISDDKIKLYLQAVQETTVAANLMQHQKEGKIISDKESVDNLSKFIADYLMKMGYGK